MYPTLDFLLSTSTSIPTSVAPTLTVSVGAVTAVGVVAGLWLARRPRNGPQQPDLRLGVRVVMAVGRPCSAPNLARIAVAFAAVHDGLVVPVWVASEDPDAATRRAAADIVRRAEAAVLETGVEASGQVRVAATICDGVLHSVVEHDATLGVIGWPLDGGIGRILDEVRTPLLVARVDREWWPRVKLRPLVGRASEGALAAVRLAVETARRVAAPCEAPVVMSGGRPSAPVRELVAAGLTDPCVLEAGPTPGAPFAEPDELTVVAVEPSWSGLRHAMASVGEVGDVVLALPHGLSVRRPLAASPRLYEPTRVR